jgi:hypothetical protein
MTSPLESGQVCDYFSWQTIEQLVLCDVQGYSIRSYALSGKPLRTLALGIGLLEYSCWIRSLNLKRACMSSLVDSSN